MARPEPKFRWLKVAQLHEPQASPRCTLLADGRVRVTNGDYWDVRTHQSRRAGTELYSPTENRWTQGDDPAATPAAAPRKAKGPYVFGVKVRKRERATLTRLPSGAVLVTGGFETTSRFDGELDDHSFREVELVDRLTDQVCDAGKLPTGTHDHGVVVLPCGAVLVIGGNEGDNHGSREVQLGVPAGLDLSLLGPALSKLAGKELGDQRREELLEEVRALTRASDFDAALELAQEAARTSPENADAWRAVGLALAAAKRFDEAVEPLRRATQLDPDDPFARSEFADALFLSGQHEDAKPHYRRVLELCRDDSTWTWQVVQRARQQLQFMALQSGDVREVARGPGPGASSLEWNNAGAAANALGRTDEARRAFERATRVDPDNDFAWGNLASVLTTLKRPKEALAAAEKALELCTDPRRKAQAFVSSGIALYDLGRYAASVEAYDASLKLHVLPYAWNNRANSLRKLDRDVEAFENFEKAAALGHHAGHWGLAAIWVQRGDLEKARTEVALAAKLDASLAPLMRDDEELASLWR